MKSRKIETIRKEFSKHCEWLLIKVDKTNNETGLALTGQLLDHSPDRDEISKKSIKQKGHILIDCSQHQFPKGFAAAF